MYMCMVTTNSITNNTLTHTPELIPATLMAFVMMHSDCPVLHGLYVENTSKV